MDCGGVLASDASRRENEKLEPQPCAEQTQNRDTTDLEQQKDILTTNIETSELPPNASLPPIADADTPYCALEEKVKVAVILTASFASIISPFSTAVYYPAVTVLSKDFGVSVSLINLTISTYQVRTKQPRRRIVTQRGFC